MPRQWVVERDTHGAPAARCLFAATDPNTSLPHPTYKLFNQVRTQESSETEDSRDEQRHGESERRESAFPDRAEPVVCAAPERERERVRFTR